MLQVAVYKIELVRGERVWIERRSCVEAGEVVAVARRFLRRADREQILALMLDADLKCVGVFVAAVGTALACPSRPADIFKAAVLTNAVAMAVAHNHPSGDPSPSREDIALTRRLRAAGEILGIPVVEHVIIGHRRYISLKEAGLL